MGRGNALGSIREAGGRGVIWSIGCSGRQPLEQGAGGPTGRTSRRCLGGARWCRGRVCRGFGTRRRLARRGPVPNRTGARSGPRRGWCRAGRSRRCRSRGRGGRKKEEGRGEKGGKARSFGG